MIIRGKAYGIQENLEKPASIFEQNISCVDEIGRAFRAGETHLLYVGSSCMYPTSASQPYKERSLGTGEIETTSSAYAYTKLACWQYCKALSSQYGVQYFTAIPGDIYGEPTSSHFIGQLIKKFHEAKEKGEAKVEIWGSGYAVREPLFNMDAEKAIQFVFENYKDTEAINIGNGREYTVGEVAKKIKEAVGFTGELKFNPTKPIGALRKCLDNSKLRKLGFGDFTELEDGLEMAYSNFKNSF